MREYGLHCTYEHLSVSLFTGDAELWHLELKPSENEEFLAHVEYCRADVSMTTLLARRLVVRRIEIDGMDVNVTRAKDGTFPQFQHLLNRLETKKSGKVTADTEITATPATPSEIDLTPPFKMDALRLQHVHVNFRDESLSPALESRLDMNVRLSDLGSEKRKTRFQVIISSPPVLNQLVVEGAGSSLGMDLLADMKIAVNGLHTQSLKDYLATIGISPEAESLTFSCNGQISTQGIEDILDDEFVKIEDKITTAENKTFSVPKTLGVHIDLSDIVLSTDGLANLVLKHIAIDANMPDSDTIDFSKIELSEGRAHAWRKANNVLSMAGLQFVGRSNLGNASSEQSQTASDLRIISENTNSVHENASTFKWSTDNLSLLDLQFILHDESVSPKTNLAFKIKSLVVEDVQPQEVQHPGQLNVLGELSVPGVVKTINITGQVDFSLPQKAVALKLSANGISPDALTPYLEAMGLESLYDNGEFTCDVNAAFGPQEDSPFAGEISITDIRLKDTNELFGLKAISFQGVRLDPNSRTTHIENVDISGQRLALGRDKAGCFNILGFRIVDRQSQQKGEELIENLPTVPNQDFSSKAVREVVEVPGEAEGFRTPPTGIEYETEAGKNNSSTPKIEIGRFSWHDNQVTFIDQAVSPAKSIIVPDFGFELKDLVLDFSGEPVSPGNLNAWLRAPGIVKQTTLSGYVSSIQAGLSLNLELASEGLTATEVAPYLQALGIDSAVTNGSLQAKLNTNLSWAQEGINCSIIVQDVALKDSDLQLAGLKRLEVEKLQARNGSLIVDKIELDQPYLTVSREQTGVLNLAGMNLLPRQESKPKTESQQTPSVRVSLFSINNGQLRWFDHAVEPAVSQILITNATLTDFASGIDAPPSTVEVTIEAPGIVKKADLSGELYINPLEQGVDLTLEATGIQTEHLIPYFSTGLRPALEDASFYGQLTGKIKQHQDGGYQANLSLSDFDYRDITGQEPLLKLDSANALITQFDPNAHIVSIKELSIHGLEVVGERKTPDIVSMLGFELQSKVSPANGARGPENEISDDSESSSAQKEQRADASTSGQRQGTKNNERSRRSQLPLITLDTLDLQLEKFTLKDQTRPATSPVIFSEFRIQNKQPIKLLGEDPDTNPVVNIDIMGKIQSFTESLTLKTELSPFAAQPRIQAELNIEQINGSGITSVVPELTNVLDANGLSNGRFSCNTELMLSMDRRNVLDFDFSKPFGLDLFLRDIKFIDADKEIILAGLEELHTDIPRLYLAQNSIHVKEIGLTKPRGIVSKENDGLHVLGLTLKAFAKEEGADANNIEVSKRVNKEGTEIHDKNGVESDAQKPNISIDQILVNGIDFSFVDNTTNPATHIPLTGLDVEVRDFATQAIEKTKPIRFNAILTAGKVSLPGKDKEQAAVSNDMMDVTSTQLVTESKDSDVMKKHLLFQEMSATGRLSLYPKPDGWIKAGLSGLELVNFKGTAGQVGMTLNDGILDASVDMRFRKEGTVSTRSQLVFTDLSLTEPPEGFLLQLLSLPTSLDTVLFILQDSEGAIKIPLAFKIDEDGLSRGQVVNAAIGATASLIANAVANSPFRIAGTVGDILGAEEKDKKAELETYVLQYTSGVTVVSDEQFREFERLLMRIQKDKNITASIRHQLGGGDIKYADSLVNLSQKDSIKLLTQLKLDKKILSTTRDKLASETQAAYAAGYHTEAWNKTQRLQKIERNLGLIERALDDLLEMMRQGTEHVAKRRTRNACIAMGKARLDALLDILTSKDISKIHNRIKFFPPRFTETQGNQGSSVSITLSSSKAR
jgi:hypothetical protein